MPIYISNYIMQISHWKKLTTKCTSPRARTKIILINLITDYVCINYRVFVFYFLPKLKPQHSESNSNTVIQDSESDSNSSCDPEVSIENSV